jgi:arsenite transporter/arsenate reductase (thioredoxin)
MLALGLLGSPRKKGNTAFLLSSFMDQLESKGAKTHTVYVPGKNIVPCKGCGFCEKHGYCVTRDDDMTEELYGLLVEADIIVAATPMYFYNATAQLKGLIDRSQTLWSRRYKLGLSDPQKKSRTGLLLAVGATKGKNLFEGIRLTAKYFFDAVSADFKGELTYRRVENPGDMEKHPDVLMDVENEAKKLDALFGRKKILFLCVENSCRSQIAESFAKHFAGDRIEALSAGSAPAMTVNPVMEEAMAEKKIDTYLRKPSSIEDALLEMKPDTIVTMGCGESCPHVPGAERIEWDIMDPKGKGIDVMRQVRDEIEANVRKLVDM